jgi:hypothetical protein
LEVHRVSRQHPVYLGNPALAVSFSPQDGTLSVTDKRTGHVWCQAAVRAFGRLVRVETTSSQAATFVWREPGAPDLRVRLVVEPELPEITVTIEGEGTLPGALAFPHPFITDAGTYVLIPMNEGISYPVEDKEIETRRFAAYAGHSGICMAFWGVTDGEQGHMAILETPDDAAIRLDRMADRLCIAPEWDAQKGTFGYARRLRYVFFDRGGHVAICKRYRAYAEAHGFLKTLQEKQAEIPNVERLIGAVNVWCWEDEPLPIVREMLASGIDRILWSAAKGTETIQALNELGVVSSTYDIIQDVMDPAMYDKLRFKHGRWPEAAWPRDLMVDANGDWTKGWQITLKDGSGMHPCGAVCDREAPKYLHARIREELETLPYTSRFIDTTTATPWRECYSLDHPMTRTDSREWKMALLRLVGDDYNLITGCETGHDAAVPYVHYFEGMLSLAHYRVPDAGRRMRDIWDEVPEPVAKFQVGEAYRLPLFELVYHDCAVCHWYWGDYNNKLPALWDKRDLFNLLYGTVPMFMFDRELWEANRERFIQSYHNTGPVAQAVGYAEMTDHRFLTQDRGVQQTTFANGVTVTVNFTGQPYELPGGVTVGPTGYEVSGLEMNVAPGSR